MIRFWLSLSFVLISTVVADPDPLLNELLKRNGDVYLLISDGAVGDLYMFDRSEDYQRSDVVPPSSPLYSRLPNYVGFSVDKFGHIKLFRTKPDIDSPNGSTSILNLTTRRHPTETAALPGVMKGTNSMNLPDPRAIDATPAGWRYVISPNGDEGWMKIYETGSEDLSVNRDTSKSGDDAVKSADMNAIQGAFRLRPIDGKVEEGSTVLPPYYKSYPLMYHVWYHAGFWQGGRQAYRVEADEVRQLRVQRPGECCGGNFTNPVGQNWHNEWFDMPLAPANQVIPNAGEPGCYYMPYTKNHPRSGEVLWNRGPTNCDSKPLSPPIGAFFMLPHVVHSGAATESRLAGYPMNFPWDYYTALRSAALVKDVKKNVKVLLVDAFLSDSDNQVMIRNAGASATFTTLQNGRDFFTSAGREGYSDARDNPLASTVSYSSELGRWNHCGDLCGLGDIPSTQQPPPSPSSTAYASSYGRDQSQQKLYMIKIASLGAGEIQTSVVEISVASTAAGAGNRQKELVTPNLNANAGVDGYRVGDADARFGTDVTQQVVYRAFATDLGYAGNLELPNFVQSLGFSKRRDGSTDYVYYSNLPASHFTVSSNFWGTGGTVWFAEERANRLSLRYANYNHTVAGSSSVGVIDAGNRLPLKAIAADGDNNVYIVHSNDTLEDAATMKRLFGNRIDRTSLETLCRGGLMVTMSDPSGNTLNCNSLTTGIPVPKPNGVTPMNPMQVTVTMKQHAGFVVEKLSPIDGSLPEKLGVIPTFQVGTCATTFNFPLDAAGDDIFNADFAAISDTGWACTVTAATFNSPDFSGINVKLGVINVPNPPASGSSTTVDIVHPCDTTPASATCDANQNLVEDTVAVFRMENPPHYGGVPAVLSQSSNLILRTLGNAAGGAVKMISNYLPTGFAYTKTLPLVSGGGTVQDLFWDNDTRIGITVATLLNEPFRSEVSTLMNARMDQGRSGTRTMRYRWQIRAKSPPHSLVDYTQNDMPYAPVIENVPAAGLRVKPNCELIRADGTSPEPVLESPNTIALKRGLLFDSCWQDMSRMIAGSASAPVYAPEDMPYNFKDPGEYEVTLMLGAVGFDLTGVTYLSDPSTVPAALVVTSYTMPVTVGSALPVANPFLNQIRVNVTDLSQNHLFRMESLFTDSEFQQAFATATANGLVSGRVGSLPVIPLQYLQGENLVIAHQDQPVPIHTAGKVEFFRSDAVNYQGFAGTNTKQSGLGSWDFEFNCPRSVFNNTTGLYENRGAQNCGVIGGVPLVDKAGLHPSNWKKVGEAAVLTAEYGNDASGDTSNRRSARIVNSDGKVFDEEYLAALSPEDLFESLHQGTLARKEHYPSGLGVVESPHGFYSWYDMKYAWFMRYRLPDGTIKQAVIRTGNMAEVFWLNWYANYSPSGVREKFQKLVQFVAPRAHNPSGMVMDDTRLLQEDPSDPYKINFRIPLLENNAILTGTTEVEMNGILRDEINADAKVAALDFVSLAQRIRPLKYPVPTGVTVLEISCQVFAPIVAWKPQKEILNSAGVGTGKFTYFDAAPALPSGASASAFEVVSDTFSAMKREYRYGEDRFTTWRGFGRVKTSFPNPPAMPFGLQQATELPGFSISDSGAVAYRSNSDHFAEVFVGDLQNPEITEITGIPQNLIAGRANVSEVTIRVRDNAPYSGWQVAPSQNETRLPQIQGSLPIVSGFYYEIGMDPRNRRGLGVLGNESYSFLQSHRTQELNGAENSLVFNKSDALSQFWPGQASPGVNLQSVSNHFHYFNEGEGNTRRNDMIFSTEVWPNPLTARPYGDADWFANRRVTQGSIFPYQPTGAMVFSHTAATSSQRLAQVAHLMPHLEDGLLNVFNFPERGDNSNRNQLRLQTQTAGTGCLGTRHPHKENPADCFLETVWEVEPSAIVAPHFFNGDYGLSLSMFATAQDARIMDDYREADTIASLNPSNFHYRLAGKSNGLVNLASLAGSKAQILREAQKQSLFHEASRIGDITYRDLTPPSLQVTLIDYKTRQPVYFVLSPVQGMNRDGFSNLLSYQDRMHIFRSSDPRAPMDETGNWFQAGSISREAQAVTFTSNSPATVEIRVSQYAGSPGNLSDFFWEIPQDTRFEIRASMSDNVVGAIQDGSLEIRSEACNLATPALNSFGIEPTMNPVPNIDKRPGNQYQDRAELRTHHVYPHRDKVDEIKVIATDAQGNQTSMCIPVRVIPQSVHFRQIGSETTRQ